MAPPLVIVIIPIVLELLITIVGDISISGLNVLSEEYSNPSLITFTLLTLPIISDSATISAPSPSEEEDPTKFGSFLYPYPPESILTLSTPPFSVKEVVV